MQKLHSTNMLCVNFHHFTQISEEFISSMSPCNSSPVLVPIQTNQPVPKPECVTQSDGSSTNPSCIILVGRLDVLFIPAQAQLGAPALHPSY